MATKVNTEQTGDMGPRMTTMEAKLTVLEKLTRKLVSQKRKPRKTREYTERERAAIRYRFLAGQEAARKRRDNELVRASNGKATKGTKKMGSLATSS